MNATAIAQPLLTPLRIGDLTLPNRVVMAPMTRARASNAELVPTPAHALYYAQRAGAGLIITEGTWVSTQSIGASNVPGMYTEAQTTAWTAVTEAVHQAGGESSPNSATPARNPTPTTSAAHCLPDPQRSTLGNKGAPPRA
ncbi:MAG: N-ethylmaleimide reductase [Pseudonocardiales bacterium]|nr:N-ethylmaleimide reductase [Pseudonocardiales bacterium]